MPGWTHDEDKELLELAHKGLSASQMMRHFPAHPSRNSIIGRLHRLGFYRKRQPRETGTLPVKPTRVQNRLSQRVRKTKTPKVEVPPVAPDLTQLATLMKMAEEEKPLSPIGFDELETHSCRYVVNDGTPVWLFCGADKAQNSSYCPRHHAACHVPGTAYRSSHPPKVPDYTEEAA